MTSQIGQSDPAFARAASADTISAHLVPVDVSIGTKKRFRELAQAGKNERAKVRIARFA